MKPGERAPPRGEEAEQVRSRVWRSAGISPAICPDPAGVQVLDGGPG